MNQPDTATQGATALDADAPNETLNFQIQHLLVATEHILRRHPAGINELGLIKTLQKPPWELISEVNFGEPDKLYPVHFLLFHVLYRLRDQLATGELPEDAINRMMDDFWAGRSGNRPAAKEVTEAAETLGFESVPPGFDDIKQRFRRAVMQAHPDRGGETETIQDLNQAFAVLKAHFRT